jgi:hypothetical protein
MSGRRSFLPYPAEIPGEAADEGAAAILALGNYVAIDRGAPANTSAAPASYVVAAIVVTPEASGIFRVNASLSLADAASESVNMSIVAAEQTAPGTPIVVNGGTLAGQVGSTAAVGSNGYTATAAGTPITFTGANTAGAKILAVKNVQTIAASDPIDLSTGGLFSFSTGGTVKTPFTIGQQCVIYVTLSAATGPLSAQNLDFTVQEQPFA